MIQGLIGYIFASRPELIALLAVSNDKKLYDFQRGETKLVIIHIFNWIV